MQLTKIMTSFHNCGRKWICQFDRNLDIYSFAFLSGTTAFESNILYFGRYLISLIHFRISTLPLLVYCRHPLSDSFRQQKSFQHEPYHARRFKPEQMDYPSVSLTQLFGDAARVSSGRAHLIDALHSNRGFTVYHRHCLPHSRKSDYRGRFQL